MIDLRRMRVLTVLQQRGSITATAQALGLTPSAVSQQVRLLSQDLRIELVKRQGRGVRLTAAAESLIEQTEALCARWESAVGDLAAAGTVPTTGKIRLCGFDTAVAGLLAPAAARLNASHPGLHVEISEAEAADCYTALLAGDCDLAVVVPSGGRAPLAGGRVDHRPLVDDPFDLLVCDSHPLARCRSVDLAVTQHDGWIAPTEGLDQHHLLTAACMAAGFSPRIRHRARDWTAMVALVAEGFGVCLIPRLVPLPAHQDVVRLPLQGSPTPFRRVLTAVRPGSRDQPAIAAALQALDEVAAHLPPPLLDDTDRPHPHEGVRGRPHRHARG